MNGQTWKGEGLNLRGEVDRPIILLEEIYFDGGIGNGGAGGDDGLAGFDGGFVKTDDGRNDNGAGGGGVVKGRWGRNTNGIAFSILGVEGGKTEFFDGAGNLDSIKDKVAGGVTLSDSKGFDAI